MATHRGATSRRFIRLVDHPLRWRLLTELATSDQRVRELVERVQQPQSLVSYHLRILRDGELVTSRRSSCDGRDTYYHLDLERCADGLARTGAALHPMLRMAATRVAPPSAPSRAVLFVCTGNSARSPIAEALLRHRANGRVTVMSAGISPKDRIHPHAVRVLREEFDIDISEQAPRSISDVLGAGSHFDRVVTLCDKARERLTGGDGGGRTHWSIPDPADRNGSARYSSFKSVSADIDTRVQHLLPTLSANDNIEREVSP